MDNLVKKFIEDNYSITVYNIEKIKNVYRVEADKKLFCFKIIKYEYGHFLFIYSAMKHLQNKGFKNIPKFIKNIKGNEYTRFNDKNAYLIEWVNARKCNFDNPLDLFAATTKLAELHKMSEGFTVTSYMKPRIGWLKWITTFRTRCNEILDFKRRINEKTIKSEFDNLYLKVLNNEIKRCNKSIEHILKTDYEIKMKNEMKRKGFCHHDYANHNILIESNGNIDIIDFDYCMLDTHLHDLASLMIRKMKNGKWSIDNALEILNNYNAINKIYQSDIPIIAAFIEFPQSYWQIGIQYYWEKQPWGEEFFIKKLKRIIDDADERQEFVNEIRKINFRRDLF